MFVCAGNLRRVVRRHYESNLDNHTFCHEKFTLCFMPVCSEGVDSVVISRDGKSDSCQFNYLLRIYFTESIGFRNLRYPERSFEQTRGFRRIAT